jgi:hypothetical protein
MEIEIWKDAFGYEGLYQVSNIGNLKRVKRIGYCSEKLIKQCSDKDGYKICKLSKNRIQHFIRVHRIVAYTFNIHLFVEGEKMVVDHINGIKYDNRYENLRIVTNRFNLTYGVRKDRNGMSSTHVGIYWYKSRKQWRATIKINWKAKELGYFFNEESAAEAYKKEFLKIYTKAVINQAHISLNEKAINQASPASPNTSSD